MSVQLLHQSPQWLHPVLVNLKLTESKFSDEVLRRWSDDLPAHVQGNAYWFTATRDGQRLDAQPGYRVHIQRNSYYVEFINDAWYILEKRGEDFVTRASNRVGRLNEGGLGWWNDTDEANPECVDISVENVNAAELAEHIERLTNTFAHLPSITVQTGLTDSEDESMGNVPQTHTVLPIFPTYAHVTTGTPFAPFIPHVPAAPITPFPLMAAPAPLTGSLKGIPPTVFTGDRGKSKQFLRKFRQFKRNNRTHEMMTVPYTRVGLTLSLIRGPAIDDWVDAREAALDDTLTRATNRLVEADEGLWVEFETAFNHAWTDTMSEQIAYQ
ncbi:hypothetical protein EDB85DRAFT_2140308 [Lactarius pseudohatsudake]|nr:hypothetical protein EDB85DRAFT_2140308 [Lactarius pseudohatsudake]